MIWSGVDPALAAAIKATAASYGPYAVEAFSGNRPRADNPSSLHPRGGAVDVNLIDRNTGRVIPNIGDAASAPIYQGYANYLYNWARQNDPALAAKLRWGGYFKGGVHPLDYMHFDIGGGPGGLPMAGGSWEGGFSPEQMAKLNMKLSGGVSQQASTTGAPVAAGGSVDVLGNPLTGGKAADQPLSLHTHTPANAGPVETYIREAAVRHGIDPDQAIRVVMSEGGQQSLSDPFRQSLVRDKQGAQEQSFGPLQLNMAPGAVGDLALKAGFDPRKDWQGAADFALANIAQHGWGGWHGWKGDPWAGIDRNATASAAFHGTQPGMPGTGQWTQAEKVANAGTTPAVPGGVGSWTAAQEVKQAQTPPPVAGGVGTWTAAENVKGGQLGGPTGPTIGSTSAPAAAPTPTSNVFPPAPDQPKDRKALWDMFANAAAGVQAAVKNNPFKADNAAYPGAARVDAQGVPTIDAQAEQARQQRMQMALALLNSGRLSA